MARHARFSSHLALVILTGSHGAAPPDHEIPIPIGTSSASCDSDVSEVCVSGSGSALLQGESQRSQVQQGDSADNLGVDVASLPVLDGIVLPPAQLDSANLRVLEAILNKETGANSIALQDLERAEKSGGAAVNAIVQGKDHEEIMGSLEKISREETPEEALKNGEVITSELLKEIDAVAVEPEETPDAVQGDMMADTEEIKLMLLQGIRAHQRWAGKLWPRGQDIPYCFESNIAPTSKRAFKNAVAHYEKYIPCLKFKEVLTQGSKCSGEGIYVTSSKPGCYANVGVAPSPWVTTCNLAPHACDSMGIAVHELGHNLGMIHEQNRPDVTKTVRIMWDNIVPGERKQYEPTNAVEPAELNDIPYDIMSVMHYGDTSFALPGKKTMEPLTKTKKVMGNRMGLTFEDAEQVAEMYGCLGKLKGFKVCTNAQGGCTQGDCMCHNDPASRTHYTKVTKAGCSSCIELCETYPSAGSNDACGCASGYIRSQFSHSSKTYYYCKDSCADKYGWCRRYKSYCGRGATIGAEVFDAACAKTCGC